MSGWHSLSGLLFSKPTGTFSRFKSKRPHYYVFEESKCQLHFYRDKHEAAQRDKEPLGSINVKGSAITLHVEDPNTFVINSEGREFVLQAENHESMMIWLVALQANRDAFASKELRPENNRMSKQIALAHRRRESAPDVTFGAASRSVGSMPGRSNNAKRITRMSTLDANSLMTRSAIEEEDEIIKDWVDCELLPELAGHAAADEEELMLHEDDEFGSNQASSRKQSSNHQHHHGDSLSARFGLSLSQSFTSGLTNSVKKQLNGDSESESETENFNYDNLVDESPKRRSAYADVQAALKPSSQDSGIEGRDARNALSSQSDDSLLDPHHAGRVQELEQELIKCKKELAELMNRDSALKEVLKKRDQQIAELDMQLSRSMRNKSAALPNLKSESSMREWMTAKAGDLKQMEEQCRIMQNNNRFLNTEVKKITHLRQMELDKFKNQDRIYREQKLELENWKRDYLFLLQSCITVPTGDVSDGFELNVHGGDRHRERLKELLEDARTVNPRLPTFESLTASECHVDSFGFKHSHDNESLLLHYICRQLHEHYTSLLDRWEQHQRQWKIFISSSRSFTKTKDLKNLVRNGVPKMYRSVVWRELVHSQIEEVKAVKGQHYYTLLTQQIHDSEVAGIHRKQISLDLLRTMPTNIRFDSLESEGIQKLQEILQALCIHNPSIGYCQGMNFLAGMGLLFLSKEDTFWLLVAITENYFHPLYFTANLIGAQADQLVLKDLLKCHLPRLDQHLQQLEIDISTVTLNWFLAVFFDAVPFQTLLRIWDCFLLEGPKVLFRFTLGILKLHERILLQQTDTISVWKHLKAAAKLTFDVEGLVKAAFEELPNMATRRDITGKQSCFINSLKEIDECRQRRRQVFDDGEEKSDAAAYNSTVSQFANRAALAYESLRKLSHRTFREMETRQVDRPIIECAGCFEDGNSWICYGDSGRTRICKLQPMENLMYNLPQEIDSRVMCICTMDSSIVLLGTLNMYIMAFNTDTEDQLWQCRIQDSVLGMCCSSGSDRCANRVFAALANGAVAVIDHVSAEEPNNNIFYVNLSSSPLTSLLLVNTDLWVACGNFVQLLDAECLDPKEKFHVSNNPFDSILCLRRSRFGIWIAVRGSSVIELWDEDSLTCCLLYDVKELKYPIFRKDDETLFNPWRITSVLPFEDSLWVGTGSGDLVVFTVTFISKKTKSSQLSDSLRHGATPAAAVRPDSLLTRSSVKEKVEKYLNTMEKPLTLQQKQQQQTTMKREASEEESTPRASPRQSPARRSGVHRMSRSSQTVSVSSKKQITVRRSNPEAADDSKLLDFRLDEDIAERDALHLEIFLQVGEATRVEVCDQATLTDASLLSDHPAAPQRQDATEVSSGADDDQSDSVFEESKQLEDGDEEGVSDSDSESESPDSQALGGKMHSDHASSYDANNDATDCFASAEETEAAGSHAPNSRPSPFRANSSSAATMQPFENILCADQPYDYNLILTVRNKVSESAIKCLLLTRAAGRGDSFIISCSTRFGEDEAVLKWRREHIDQQIWTNEPIFEVNPITKAIQLPAYMTVRNRASSSRSEQVSQQQKQQQQRQQQQQQQQQQDDIAAYLTD